MLGLVRFTSQPKHEFCRYEYLSFNQPLVRIVSQMQDTSTSVTKKNAPNVPIYIASMTYTGARTFVCHEILTLYTWYL